MSALKFIGKYRCHHYDRLGRLKAIYNVDNGITDEGANLALDIMFHAATQLTLWYIGLIDASGFVSLASSDVMNSHAGWAECVAYAEANRQQWVMGAPAARVITSSANSVFTINATKTIKGFFLSSSNTKNGTTGKLWSTGLFADGDKPVSNGDSFKTIYTVND